MSVNYKEVFQLAQDKGYKPFYKWGWIDIDKNLKEKYIERFSFLELTLIQKWLRDEHNLIVIIIFSDIADKKKPYCALIKASKRFLDKFIHPTSKTYEQALLEGCKSALELI